MRSRGLSPLLLLLAVVSLSAGACSDAEPAQEAADRAVGAEDPGWDAEQAILRTVLIEGALEDGFGRTAAGCMIDTTLAAGDFTLADLEGSDGVRRIHIAEALAYRETVAGRLGAAA